PAPMLQRRCSCGGTPGSEGECAACNEKRLQRRQSDTSGGHDFSRMAVLSAAPVALAKEADPHPPAPDTGGLSSDMLRQIASRLRQAMEGWGTDETAIYSALGGRTQTQVDAITSTYASLFNRSLTDDLRDELTDSELRELGSLAPQHQAGSPEETAPAQQGQAADT